MASALESWAWRSPEEVGMALATPEAAVVMDDLRFEAAGARVDSFGSPVLLLSRWRDSGRWAELAVVSDEPRCGVTASGEGDGSNERSSR